MGKVRRYTTPTGDKVVVQIPPPGVPVGRFTPAPLPEEVGFAEPYEAPLSPSAFRLGDPCPTCGHVANAQYELCSHYRESPTPAEDEGPEYVELPGGVMSKRFRHEW